MIRAQGIVRNVVVEKDGRIIASFMDEGAYFTVPAHLADKLRKAEKDGREVAFTHDIDMNILDVA